MRTLLLSLAITLGALATGQAAKKAPVPKDKPQPSIDGKYNLVSVSTPADRAPPNPNGFGGRGGFVPQPQHTSSHLIGPALVTKGEILIEGRSTGWDNFGQPLPANGLEMTYSIDTTKSPMTIDLFTINPRGKKVPSVGLVELMNDRLVIAVAKEGDERPKNLDEVGEVTVYYFRKAPPPPKTEVRIIAMTVGKEAEAEQEINKLMGAGFELVSTNAPAAPDAKSAPTTVHFVLKRVRK
ncbi:MAG TPA: hypothetical protein VGE74_03585 [Gemmata sp.]